jgi:hypothetical protein
MMKKTSILGNDMQRSVLLLLAGMSTALVVADGMIQVQTAVNSYRASHQPLHLAMPAGLLVDCVLQKKQSISKAVSCSVRLG